MIAATLLLTMSSVVAAYPSFSITTPIPPTITSGAFPKDFVFGTSTAAYQVEGGWMEGGKGMSQWDAYSHTPGLIANGDTGDVANDMYHLYPQDIALMKAQGLKHYRFSISWNRIMPTGVAPVNQEALDYYNDLINQLLANGIEPHATIFHNDIPLSLMYYPNLPMPFMDSERFPLWFRDYSEVLFREFGDRVQHWFTFNEPFCTAVYGTYGDTV
jgi:beta-glucosidase/6-phospho-beta-glucosidase/beta-galactosidase